MAEINDNTENTGHAGKSRQTEESKHIAAIAAAFMDELTHITSSGSRPTVETEVSGNTVRSITCAVQGGPVSYRFVYSVHTPFGGKRSTLEARIYYPQISYDIGLSPYDLADKLGEDCFTCFIYPMIESPERMRTVVRALASELSRHSGKIASFADDGTAAGLIEKKEAEIAETLKAETILKEGLPEDRARVLSMYYSWHTAKMTSGVYEAFALGKAKRAMRLASKPGASDYEASIGDYIEKMNGDYPSPCADGCNTFKGYADTQKKNTGKDFGRFMLSWLAVFPITMIALLGVYYIVAEICSQGAFYSTMTEFFSAVCVILPALITSICVSFFVAERMARKTKDENERNYQLIMSSSRTKGCMSVLTNAVAIASIITTALFAASGVVMTDTGIVDSRGLLSSGTRYPYDEVASFEYENDTYDPSYCFAGFRMKSGKTVDLGYIGEKSVTEKIIPALEKYGTEIINKTKEASSR